MKLLLAIITLAAALVAACAGYPAATAIDPAEVALQATVVAVRTAVAAELGPAETPAATLTATRGDPVRGATLIAAVATAQAAATPTPAVVCTDELLARLRLYKADGATAPLTDTVQRILGRSGKPLGDTLHWSLGAAGGSTCTLMLSVTYANEPLTLTWRYDDSTGHLAAQDAQTRFYSGW